MIPSRIMTIQHHESLPRRRCGKQTNCGQWLHGCRRQGAAPVRGDRFFPGGLSISFVEHVTLVARRSFHRGYDGARIIGMA